MGAKQSVKKQISFVAEGGGEEEMKLAEAEGNTMPSTSSINIPRRLLWNECMPKIKQMLRAIFNCSLLGQRHLWRLS